MRYLPNESLVQKVGSQDNSHCIVHTLPMYMEFIITITIIIIIISIPNVYKKSLSRTRTPRKLGATEHYTYLPK